MIDRPASIPERIEILLLEDDDRDAELLALRLELDGVQATITRTHDRASFLSALDRGRPDLILSDYNLPAYDGREALDSAREIAPDVPFLFVSGAMGEEIAIESLKRGATDYVLKHRLERLTPAVRRALLERANQLERRRVESERDALLEAEQLARREAERASAAHRFLADASKALASTLDLREALDRVLHLAVASFVDWISVDLTTPEGTLERIACAHRDAAQEPALAAWWSLPGMQDLDAPSVLEVVRTQSTCSAQNRDGSASADLSIGRLGAAAWVIVPISARERPIGALIVAARAEACSIPEHDVALAEELARRIAMAVDNARLYEEAQTERQRAEHANRAKDEFLATVSHELRTPLNAISGWAKMLRSGLLPREKHARAIEVIERNTQIQTQLIDDLLDVTRIVSGKLRLTPSAIELRQLVEMAVEGVRPQAEAKSITLRIELSTDPVIVHADADRLQQVMWNLITNAVKFTPQGGRVDISVGAIAGGAEIVVRDDGRGIRADFLPNVFDRFRQSESGTTRAHGGLGLGLTIVRHIVELHGGQVEAHSDGEGRGATFAVRLPASARPGGPRQVAAIARPSLRPTLHDVPCLRGVHVLIVDDETDARDLLVSVFQDLEASVTPASCAAEAIAAMSKSLPHVMVSDIGMPGEDGYTLIRRLRALSPEHGGRVPAIALTAYAAPEDRARALEEGFDRHFAKPVEPSQLAMVVAELTSATRPRAS